MTSSNKQSLPLATLTLPMQAMSPATRSVQMLLPPPPLSSSAALVLPPVPLLPPPPPPSQQQQQQQQQQQVTWTASSKTTGRESKSVPLTTLTEPQPLSREERRQKMATSDSGSEDASRRDEQERKWQPKSLRANPTDDDPFGDAKKIPPLEMSPLPVQKERFREGEEKPYIPSQLSPAIPLVMSMVAQAQQTSPPLLPLALHQSMQPMQQHMPQQQQQPYFYSSQPTIIVIPPSLADSLGQSLRSEQQQERQERQEREKREDREKREEREEREEKQKEREKRDQSAEFTNTTMSRLTNTAASTTMGPLPFQMMQQERMKQRATESSISQGSRNAARGERGERAASVAEKTLQVEGGGKASNESRGTRKMKSTTEYNQTFREQRDLLSSSGSVAGSPTRQTQQQLAEASRSGLESAKMHILARPQLLLNVFTFWINLIACHGSVNHNQCVHAMLSDLRTHFLQMVEKKRAANRLSATEEERVEIARKRLQIVLDELRDHLDDRSYDTTRSIVDATNCVGPYVLRHFLVKRGVVSLDPNANDTAIVWASLIASSDPTLPFEDASKITDPRVMLERMAWSKRVSIPGV